jgi:hypothetical protein
MENLRRQDMKDGYNEKTRKDSFTATERICHSRTSKVLWMEIVCKRGTTTDGHFGHGDNEKGLIITVRYWGLDFFASEASGEEMSWNYRKSDYHTSKQGILD